ncbi:MAG: PP2C family protein-serine/threonine phosphatase [Candidatus Eisenbacteria bacterium]
METGDTEEQQSRPGGRRGIAATMLGDLKHGDLRRGMRKDLRDLYRFYLDEEEQARLKAMWRVKRWFVVLWWILKSMILSLSPVRRVLAVLSLLFLMLGDVGFRAGSSHFHTDLSKTGFLLLLIVLMLELKDKLLARDELKLGRAVQLALLPGESPALPGWDIWLFSRPANDVGGDLVDYLKVDERRLDLVLADVSGKGLGAALLMAKLQATLRGSAGDFESPSALIAHTNVILYRDTPSGSFATAVYMALDPEAGTVRLVNAGHMPPIRVKHGSHDTLPPVAPPLGVVPDSDFPGQTVQLGRGEMLLLYSDGVTEACNAQEEFFGDDRLAELVPDIEGLSAEAAGRRIVEQVEKFVGDEPTSDDLSLILLRRL